MAGTSVLMLESSVLRQLNATSDQGVAPRELRRRVCWDLVALSNPDSIPVIALN